MKFFEQIKEKSHYFNIYKCDCGETLKVRADSSRKDFTCKCSKKTFKSRKYYGTWRAIIKKSNKLDKNFQGFTICDEWKDFSIFEKWSIENAKEGYVFAILKGSHYSEDTCAYISRKESFVINNVKEKIEKTNLEKYGCKSTLSLDSVQKKIKETNLERYGCENNLSNKEIRNKVKNTNLERYGVENPFQSEEVKNKIKNTCLEKYGSENYLSSDLGKESIKKIFLEKYEVEYYSCTKEFIEKSKKTSLEKYGVEYPSKSKEVKDKRESTMIERYSVQVPIQSKEIKEKIQNTCLKRYGSTSPLGTKEVLQKSKETCLRKYGVDHHSKRSGYKYIIRKALKANGTNKTYNNKLMVEIAEEKGLVLDSMYKRIKKYGPDIAMSMQKKESGLETFFEESILKPLNIPYEKQFRISNRIADFKINNLILECDGLYWHSEAYREKNYHKEKRELYISEGFTSLFFTEDEILNQKEKVESIILNKLNRSNRIFARKCVIRELSKDEANEFFANNHLMGKGRGRAFGLYYNNNLVTAIRVFRLGTGLDVSRFCHQIQTNVIGGFSKLIKHVEKTLNPSFVQTFIDLRYGSGEYLNSLGFEKKTEYLSFSWVKNSLKVHRMNFPSNSGYNSGFVKLWDCGQAKYIKSIY